jgi:hypothetical protein
MRLPARFVPGRLTKGKNSRTLSARIPNAVAQVATAAENRPRAPSPKLISVREKAGLTQREVSARTARAHSFLSKCETGERSIEVFEFLQLAQIYKKPPQFFLDPDQVSFPEKLGFWIRFWRHGII